MTHFRFRWKHNGGHVHVTLWSGTERLTTHGRNGTLIFREEEWENFKQLLMYGVPNASYEIVTQNTPLPGYENEN